MNASGLSIKHLIFTGPFVGQAQLNFEAGLNLLYGASNTGKSFALKAIDFMLGGAKDLPEFSERDGYDKLWLGFTLEGVGDFTLSRSLKGGSYELHNNLVSSVNLLSPPQILAPTHNSKNPKSLSQFLLEQLNFSGKRLARNAQGVTDPISFRDIAEISLVDEISIQSERSPIETGQHTSRPKERSFFRFLLTGIDDSAITPVMDQKTFHTSKTVRMEVIQEMLDVANANLSSYSEVDHLAEDDKKLTSMLEAFESDFSLAQDSIRGLMEEKHLLSIEMPRMRQRVGEIQNHLVRFAQLDEVYCSDIERLGALEEAGFLLSLNGERDCALCGAPASAQVHVGDIDDIELVQKSALVEIAKIQDQRIDLKLAVSDLQKEADILKLEYQKLSAQLDGVEQKINRLAPMVNENKRSIREIIGRRDRVRSGLSLLEQKNSLIEKLDKFRSLEKPSKEDRPNLKTPDSATHQFCQIVSDVLKAWKFPGNCHISFDDKTYDLKIDGKLRINNGKGVRAVTHAAFMVGLLIYCRENNLPHSGFLVLDTPLLAYRDPMQNPRDGSLTYDEKIIAKSDLKKCFFDHLSSIGHLGQFIVLENIDPPDGVEQQAYVQTFYGKTGSGRNGLFPIKGVGS